MNQTIQQKQVIPQEGSGKFTYRVIGNLSFVDVPGVGFMNRLWAHILIIDDGHHLRKEFQLFGSCNRQIRGLSWGGQNVFTIWVPQKEDGSDHPIEIVSTDPCAILLSNDGAVKPICGVADLIVGPIRISLASQNSDEPFMHIIHHCDTAPFERTVDKWILEYEDKSIYRPYVKYIPASAGVV